MELQLQRKMFNHVLHRTSFEHDSIVVIPTLNAMDEKLHNKSMLSRG